jgi:hypothetical protein
MKQRRGSIPKRKPDDPATERDIRDLNALMVAQARSIAFLEFVVRRTSKISSADWMILWEIYSSGEEERERRLLSAHTGVAASLARLQIEQNEAARKRPSSPRRGKER